MSTDVDKWKIYAPLIENADSYTLVNVLLKIQHSEPENGALVYVQSFGYVFEYIEKYDAWENTFRSPHELLIVMGKINDMKEFNKRILQFEGEQNYGSKHEATA